MNRGLRNSITGVALAAGMIAGLVQAGQPVNELLRRMDSAFAKLNYDGIFTFFDGTDMASLRVVHKLQDGVARERLVHLTGAPREFVRHGDEVDCIVMPGDDLLEVEKRVPAGPFARAYVREFDRVADTYRVIDAGEGRVAGRPTRVVEVQPRDEHRFGYRLWIDRETDLLLRSEMVDQYDRQLEIFMFTQVLIGDDVDDAALAAERAAGSIVNHMQLQSADAEPVYQMPGNRVSVEQWRTGWLPPGFVMSTMNQRSTPASGNMVNNLIYSDGLAAVSVFIEEMPAGGAATMVSTNGATVAMTHGLRTAQGNYLLTLVGEVPVPTAQQIVESVYLAAP